MSHPSRGSAPAAAVLAAVPDAVLSVDADGRLTGWNSACQALLGHRAEEVLGRHADHLGAGPAPALGALLGSATAVQQEVALTHADGHVVTAFLRATRLHDSDGRPAGAVGVLHPDVATIGLRFELEQARTEAAARFLQSPVAQASMDPQSRITAVNPALWRLSGYTEADVVGRPVTEFMAPEDREVASDRLGRFELGQQSVSRHRRRLRRADGSLRQVDVSLFTVQDADGRVLGLEAVLEDVTAQVVAEQTLRASEARWRALALRAGHAR